MVTLVCARTQTWWQEQCVFFISEKDILTHVLFALSHSWNRWVILIISGLYSDSMSKRKPPPRQRRSVFIDQIMRNGTTFFSRIDSTLRCGIPFIKLGAVESNYLPASVNKPQQMKTYKEVCMIPCMTPLQKHMLVHPKCPKINRLGLLR